MKAGRKNLKRAVEEESLNLEDGHTIMQVLSLRGSNLIEVLAVFFYIFIFIEFCSLSLEFYSSSKIYGFCFFFPLFRLIYLMFSLLLDVLVLHYYFCFFKVMDAQGKTSLALFPAKFQKSMWIKRGVFYIYSEPFLI